MYTVAIVIQRHPNI